MDKSTWTARASSPQRHETCSRPPGLPGLHTAAQGSSEPRLPRWNGRIFSQLGADGMLWKLFEDLGTTNRFFVEFGTQDGLSCNSRTLRLDCGWDGLMMDGGVANPSMNLAQHFITRENIVQLFAEHMVPKAFDLLSVDIDGNDWHALHAILAHKYRPRVIIVEVNPHLPLYQDMIIRYEPSFSWDFSCYHSGSRLAFKRLARHFNYSVVGELFPDLYLVADEALISAPRAPLYAHINDIAGLKEDSEDTVASTDVFYAGLLGFGFPPQSAFFTALLMNKTYDAWKRPECRESWTRRGFETAFGLLHTRCPGSPRCLTGTGVP